MDEKIKKAHRIESELRLKARAWRRLRANQPSVLQDTQNAICTAGKMFHTPTPCSCAMCGNPRRHAKGADRETLAETKARLKEMD